MPPPERVTGIGGTAWRIWVRSWASCGARMSPWTTASSCGSHLRRARSGPP